MANQTINDGPHQRCLVNLGNNGAKKRRAISRLGLLQGLTVEHNHVFLRAQVRRGAHHQNPSRGARTMLNQL